MRALVLIVAIGCSESQPADPPDDPAPVAPADASPVPTPLEAARAAIARGCETGDAKACLAAGKNEEACVHGESRGCLAIAELGGPRASLYLARACRRGARQACARLPRPLKDPRLVGGSGLGEYGPAVLDCWAETEGVDRDRELRGSIAVTVGLDGRTTAIARFDNEPLRTCIETSASRWVFGENHDVELTIRPRHLDDPFAGLTGESFAVLGGGGLGKGGGLGGGSGLGFGLRTPVRVRVRVHEIGDTLDDDRVERRIRRSSRGLERCYDESYRYGFQRRVSVTLRVTITPTGAVDDVRASSAASDKLRRCVKDQARRWRFPPPRTETGRPAISRLMITLDLERR